MSQGVWSLLTIQDLRGVVVQSTNPGSKHGREEKKIHQMWWQFQDGSMVVVVGWSNILGWGILLPSIVHSTCIFLGSRGDCQAS